MGRGVGRVGGCGSAAREHKLRGDYGDDSWGSDPKPRAKWFPAATVSYFMLIPLPLAFALSAAATLRANP